MTLLRAKPRSLYLWGFLALVAATAASAFDPPIEVQPSQPLVLSNLEGRRMRLEFSLPQQAPRELFLAAAHARAQSTDTNETCVRLIEEWHQGEVQAEQREFSPLLVLSEEIIGGDPNWKEAPARLEMYADAVAARKRACAKRIARERALISRLAAAVGDTPDSGAWQELVSRLEATRGALIRCALPGAQVDLAGWIPMGGVSGSTPADADSTQGALQRYMMQMSPLWNRKILAWDRVLEHTVERGYPYAQGPGISGARREWADAALGVQLANEWWARQFGSVVGGPHGQRLTLLLLSKTCPAVDLGWDCTFESLNLRAEETSDPDTARAIVADWQNRCDQIRDLNWAQERGALERVLSGEVVSRVSRKDRQARVLEALNAEGRVHGGLLEILGCDLSQDPCVRGLVAAAERLQHQEIMQAELYQTMIESQRASGRGDGTAGAEQH